MAEATHTNHKDRTRYNTLSMESLTLWSVLPGVFKLLLLGPSFRSHNLSLKKARVVRVAMMVEPKAPKTPNRNYYWIYVQSLRGRPFSFRVTYDHVGIEQPAKSKSASWSERNHKSEIKEAKLHCKLKGINSFLHGCSHYSEASAPGIAVLQNGSSISWTDLHELHYSRSVLFFQQDSFRFKLIIDSTESVPFGSLLLASKSNRNSINIATA